MKKIGERKRMLCEWIRKKDKEREEFDDKIVWRIKINE